ncbi:hypothetical protein BBFL7_02129 [Flavobacteria bacterium BBFL7]|nr:hypothetical protein BBFL7_02129 [Flavobacteria bacterium BBFL7]
MESLSDLEILYIITDDKDSHKLADIKQAQLIAEMRGLDIYLYINDRDTYFRIAKKEKAIDNRASIRLRLINFIVDFFSFVVLISLIHVILSNFGSDGIKYNWSNYQRIIGSVILFLYYFIQEFFWNKTLGKIVTGTIVVSEKDQKPNITELLMRTACRFIPLEAFSFAFMKDGFHDIFSKTKVIENKK